MPIPDNVLFESFLSETKLVKNKPDGSSVPFTTGRATLHEAPVLYLSYPEIDLKFESVIKRIISGLNDVGCVADSDIALATLGLIVETREPETSSIGHANQCLSLLHSAQLHYSIVLPSKVEPGYEIPLGKFSLRAFDPQKLLYWAGRGNSSYPINLHQLKGCIALEQAPVNTKLIHWEMLPGGKQLIVKWGERLAMASIVDAYYQAVAEHYSRQIPTMIKEYLLLQESGALLHFDIDRFLSTFMADKIGLFHWQTDVGHQSWALLNRGSAFNINLCPSKLFSDCERWFTNEFGVHVLSGNRPLDSTTASYCRFLQRAHAHRLQDRPDEAFLHFVIALDLLLGLEGRSSESVCLRAATLVHRQSEKTLNAQISDLKRLYDRRSKYVHEGKSINENDLLEIEKICTEVLWDLLATSALGQFSNIDDWLKQIDFIASALKASREIPETEFQSVGIPMAGCSRIPPNRIMF